MRILIAEDDKDLAKALKRVLEISEYEVVNAYNGLEALDTASTNKFDLIILDVMMPKMNGYEEAKSLRNYKNYTPIIMLTARSETDDKVLGLDSGADDYLTKPFQIKELLARIRALIRRNSGIDNNELIYDDITLNSSTYELSSVKGKVRLTSKEFSMMKCFITYSNSLLSTERLMELVWDYDSEAEINVVWAYISSLRKKLNQIGSKNTIQAVRGVGYKIGGNDD